jgi:two-component system, response regulator RegA
VNASKAPSELPTTVMLIDDDEVYRLRLAKAFRDRRFAVVDFADADSALARARTEPPEIAIVDLRMPGLSGLDAVRTLKNIEPATRVLVLTGYGSIATALEAVRLGAVHYLTKPATLDEIIKSLGGGEMPAGADEEEVTVPSLARVEWEHINRVVTECNGNVSRAARLLHMHRRSLQRKLAKYPVIR